MQTESLFADQREPFFNSIGHKRKADIELELEKYTLAFRQRAGEGATFRICAALTPHQEEMNNAPIDNRAAGNSCLCGER